MPVKVVCPVCISATVIKFGKSAEGKQRYRCRNMECKKNTFIQDYSYNGHQPEIREQIITMALNAKSMSTTACTLQVSINTVKGTIKKQLT